MAKRHFQLAGEQVQELTHAYHQCKDGPTRSRYQAVRLYGSGYLVGELLTIVGCSRTSLLDWCRIYRAQGTAGLVDKRAGGNHAHLRSAQIADLRQRLGTYSPRQVLGATTASADGQFWTVADLEAAVALWYGVTYQSPSSYLHLLTVCGFSYQRPAKVFPVEYAWAYTASPAEKRRWWTSRKR